MKDDLFPHLGLGKTTDERAWNLTASLLDKMPPDLRAMTWAAAIPHWFDADILAALRPELRDRATRLYADLQTLSFVEVFPGRGHNIHELTRRLMLDHLWRENLDEFRALSARAVEIFSGRDEIAFRIENAYHLLVAEPDEGADAVWNLGADLNNSFRYAELEAFVNTALEQVNADRVAGRARGWVLYREGRLENQTYRREALRTLENALADAEQDRQLRANVLSAMGDVQQFRKDMNAALASYAQALELFRAVGDRLGEANVLSAMGDVQQFRKDMNAALASYGQALELFRAVGDRLGEANVYGAMSRLDLQVGNIAEAEKLVARAVEIHQQIGDHYSVAADWGRFAIVLHNLGDKDRARACAARAEPFFREIGHPAADTMRKIMQD